MNKQEFIDSIKNGPLSPEIKEKVLALLEGELTFDVKEQIKDLIQEDIESDISFLTEADKKDIETDDAEMAAELDAVEKDLAEDMKFVENELNNLEAMVKEVDAVVDEAHIDSLKSQIEEQM